MLPRQKMWRIYYFVNLQKIPGMYSGMYFWRISMGIVGEEEKVISGEKNTIEFCES